MSAGFSARIQSAIYGLLQGDVALSGLIDGVFDAPPPGGFGGMAGGVLVLIGEDEVQDRSDGSGGGAEHRILLAVDCGASGFLAAKQASARICDLIEAGAPVIAPLLAASPGGAHLVAIRFEGMRARRLEAGQRRRVELRFGLRLSW